MRELTLPVNKTTSGFVQDSAIAANGGAPQSYTMGFNVSGGPVASSGINDKS